MQSTDRYLWFTAMELTPGMVVARPILAGAGNLVTMKIAVGVELSANSIAQLIHKGVECVAIFQDAPADEVAYANDLARYEKRLVEIFGSEPDEACRQLMQVLLNVGPV